MNQIYHDLVLHELLYTYIQGVKNISLSQFEVLKIYNSGRRNRKTFNVSKINKKKREVPHGDLCRNTEQNCR